MKLTEIRLLRKQLESRKRFLQSIRESGSARARRAGECAGIDYALGIVRGIEERQRRASEARKRRSADLETP